MRIQLIQKPTFTKGKTTTFFHEQVALQRQVNVASMKVENDQTQNDKHESSILFVILLGRHFIFHESLRMRLWMIGMW
ncbi:hypothetical protein Mapa_000779 [Marchantia paleacea]|nr:hypothetical protein Mapa_000779 [Marchantia paleacea]